MCGTPHVSRVTRTGAERPATSTVPESGATAGADGCVARLHAGAAMQTAKQASTLSRMAIKEGLLAEYDHEMGTTRRLLERIPDHKLAWKPHDKSMAFGALATHLGNIPTWGATILNESSFDLADAPPNLDPKASRGEILTSFDGTVKSTRALMDKCDAEYMAPWTLKRGGQNLFTLPRIAAFRSFVIHHTIHHRGQLSVYLRLNEIPVPAIYGPSADEG
jgi:uncharacterized damage-inducible protein DinB